MIPGHLSGFFISNSCPLLLKNALPLGVETSTSLEFLQSGRNSKFVEFQIQQDMTIFYVCNLVVYLLLHYSTIFKSNHAFVNVFMFFCMQFFKKNYYSGTTSDRPSITKKYRRHMIHCAQNDNAKDKGRITFLKNQDKNIRYFAIFTRESKPALHF